MSDVAWGLGVEPFPANVPAGTQGVDKFGNRTVTQADGTVLVEGIGSGVNAGKPDGQWWPANPLLAAGPTNADAWVADNSQGTAEDATGQPIASAAPAAPAAPVVVAKLAEVAPATVPTPKLTVLPHTDGVNFIATIERDWGLVESRVVATFKEAVDWFKSEWAKVHTK